MSRPDDGEGKSSRQEHEVGWAHGPLVAEAYDAKAPVGHSYGDVEYYSRHLAGRGGRILEVGSGTGRILIPLTEAGLTVDGLEYSPDMLGVCRRNCAQRGLELQLFEGDVTEFAGDGTYDAVIGPAGVISTVDGRERTRQALACLRDSLRPGGELILDLDVPRRGPGPQPPRIWHRGDHIWTAEVLDARFDPASNQTTEYVKYEKWSQGEHTGSELHIFRTQHWVPEAFGALLTEVGFTDVRVCANYDDHLAPGSKEDRDWTFHAVRAAG